MSRTVKPAVFIFLFSVLLCSCRQHSTPNYSAGTGQISEGKLRWVISVDGALNKPWSSVEILSEITERTGILPEIELVTEDYEQIVIKWLQAGEQIDLITFEAHDPVIMRMEHIQSIVPVSSLPEILQYIPENVQQFHKNSKGELLYVPGGFGYSAQIPAEGVYINKNLRDHLKIDNPVNTESFFTLGGSVRCRPG